ncbi:U1 small nuclear ribonucleoprotein 70 kDa [Pimephales promelas]|nr:U1 small nuclear ribonucleoprotein 70 kDa [Pimephales promelas]
MTQFLPPNLLALFAPRDPIPFLTQLEKLPHEKHHNQPYCGIAPFIRHFEDPRDAPPPTRAETRDERLERKRREKMERRQVVVETELKLWDPHNDTNAQGDAFKTLFVARINYDTTESKLRREFEVYGPIKRIYIVYNKKTGKPRGYAFIEYEHERDMHSAYKHADGKKIDGRRVLVDVERGRTVKGWHPRRLGGGLGGTRRGGADVNIKHSGRDDTSRYDDRPIGRQVVWSIILILDGYLSALNPIVYYPAVTVIGIVANAGNAVVTETRSVESAESVAALDPERDADTPDLGSVRGLLWFRGRRLGAAADAEKEKETEVPLEAAERGVETGIEKETAKGEAGAGIEREIGKEARVQKEERKAWVG